MKYSFEISVKINGQKFDICINEDKRLFSFTDIYPKLKEVVKIGAKEDIEFETHEFKLFEGNEHNEHGQSINGILIKSLKHFIKPKSLIAIKSKPKQGIRRLNGRLIPLVSSDDTKVERNNDNKNTGKESNPLPDIPQLLEQRKDIENFHRIVLAINIGWNFRTDNPINVWRKVSAALRSQSIVISAEKCCTIFNTWVNNYSRSYDIYEGQISRSSQEVFDLLKVVHTLELRQLLRDTNQTLNKIQRIGKTGLLKEFFRKYLTEIYEKKLKEKEVEPTISKVRKPVVPPNPPPKKKRKYTQNEVEERNNSIYERIMVWSNSNRRRRRRRGMNVTSN